VLRAAAELGHRGLEYLLGAVMAERGVNAWWTAERRKRLHGVPLEERPTTEEMLRDLLPAVHHLHFGTPKTDSDEDLQPLVQKTFFALRDPGVLDNLEILAQRRAIGVSDALEGIALALDPRLKLPRGRGRRPPSFDRREFDQFSLLLYRLTRADAKARRAGNRVRGERSLDEETALKWLAKERKRTGDPRPVEESDQDDALNAVAALKRRVKARQAEFGKRATFMKRKG
jgi:hypothetical protein